MSSASHQWSVTPALVKVVAESPILTTQIAVLKTDGGDCQLFNRWYINTVHRKSQEENIYVIRRMCLNRLHSKRTRNVSMRTTCDQPLEQETAKKCASKLTVASRPKFSASASSSCNAGLVLTKVILVASTSFTLRSSLIGNWWLSYHIPLEVNFWIVHWHCCDCHTGCYFLILINF